MTTTIAFLTRNCAVLGCDSLATTSRRFLDPFQVLEMFYDFEDTSKSPQPRRDSNGALDLPDFGDVFVEAREQPVNQLPSYTKMFQLEPAAIGVMFAGVAVVNGKSMRNLVDEFLATSDITKYLRGNHGVHGLYTRLNTFLFDEYSAEYGPGVGYGPDLWFTVVGYSKNKNRQHPEAYQGRVSAEGATLQMELKPGNCGFIFGGQHDVIERVTRGMDFGNIYRYERRVNEILSVYRGLAQEAAEAAGFKGTLPDPRKLGTQLDTSSTDWVRGHYTDPTAFSEQAAIDYVDFLVNLMIKSQHFGDSIPTVGGDIHIAIITKRTGFQWISAQEYKYRERKIPKL